MRWLVVLMLLLGGGHSIRVQARQAFSCPPALHYWQNFDFKVPLWETEPEKAEQLFVGYLDILSKSGTSVQEEVDSFVRRAYRYPASRLYFSDLVEHYLFNLNSSRHNDTLYISFLKATLASPYLSDDEKFRYRFQLENVRKNMPGKPAADFVYLDRKGQRHRMYDIQSDYLVVFFYNPDCVRCHNAEQYLSGASVFQNAAVKVLAIYPGFQTDEWLSEISRLPGSWLDGCSPEGEINNKLLYFIQSSPAIYLLDKHKKVLLKDASPKSLLSYLERLNL